MLLSEEDNFKPINIKTFKNNYQMYKKKNLQKQLVQGSLCYHKC
jgi:hypothetical protein